MPQSSQTRLRPKISLAAIVSRHVKGSVPSVVVFDSLHEHPQPPHKHGGRRRHEPLNPEAASSYSPPCRKGEEFSLIIPNPPITKFASPCKKAERLQRVGLFAAKGGFGGKNGAINEPPHGGCNGAADRSPVRRSALSFADRKTH